MGMYGHLSAFLQLFELHCLNILIHPNAYIIYLDMNLVRVCFV